MTVWLAMSAVVGFAFIGVFFGGRYVLRTLVGRIADLEHIVEEALQGRTVEAAEGRVKDQLDRWQARSDHERDARHRLEDRVAEAERAVTAVERRLAVLDATLPLALSGDLTPTEVDELGAMLIESAAEVERRLAALEARA